MRNWGLWAIGAGIVWAASYFAARAALEALDMSQAARTAVALAPALPFAAFLGLFIAHMRSADELHRKVQLEALAIAFPLAVLMLMVLGLLQLVVDLPEEDWSYRHVWAFLPLFYFAGLGVAWRRYR